MAEENKEKKSIFLRILGICLRSPIGTLFALALIYFAFQAYVLGNSPLINKGIMLGICILWGLWFLARNMFKLLLVIVILIFAAYGYYAYNQREIAKCEAAGGVWNKETGICEEKLSLWQRLEKLWKEYVAKDDSETDTAKSK